MRRPLWIASTLTLIALAGCGGGSTTTVTETTTSTASSSTTTSSTTTSSTTSTTPTTTTGQSSIDTSGDFTFFTLPSGNIGCSMSRKEVRCDISKYSYSPPPQPGSCPLDWGDSLSIGRSGSARFVCHGDTVLSQGAETLEYGAQVSRDGFTCASSEAGVRCQNSAGSGFTLAREEYGLF